MFNTNFKSLIGNINLFVQLKKIIEKPKTKISKRNSVRVCL